jgi:hypothetical protein
MARERHLSVVPDAVTDARETALAQVASRVTPGEWHTPEATALFESMQTLESSDFTIGVMQRTLGMEGLVAAFMDWVGREP